ncbi:hypothetical protein B0H13DRAFT_1924823 [Mycena leptocephala]|nr:hypothetical protein B0H13DRAFT_1924823 [Mycena leptocephala]
MPPRAWLANYRHYLEKLLLSVEELSDPHWEPDTSVDVFLQARVRPAVYFLQRCAVGEGGLQGPPVDIPSSEKEELCLLALRLAGTIRFLSRVRVYRGLVETVPTLPLLLQDTPGLSLENYRVPGCATNMMAIIMVLLGRLCDVGDRDRQALSICLPILQVFRATAVAAARRDHTDTEYPQFHRNGLLQELFYEIDLVPEEVTLKVSPFESHASRYSQNRCSRSRRVPQLRLPHRRADGGLRSPPFHGASTPRNPRTSVPVLPSHLRGFTWSPETKTKGEKRVMRQRVRDYLEMAGRLSDYVIRHHDLAEANRIPTPRVAWLQVVMRADSVYGFEGTTINSFGDIEGQDRLPAAIFRTLCQHAGPYRSLSVGVHKFAHVEYVREHLALLRTHPGCIPSAVTVPDDLPDGRAEFFAPTSARILKRRAALEYAKSNVEAPFLDPSNALLQDEIEASQGIGRGLEKAVAQAEAGYGQSPSRRYFVQPSVVLRHRWLLRLGIVFLRKYPEIPLNGCAEELVILWIHRSRHLAQQLHRTTRAAPVAETPEVTVGLIRDTVSVLLKNMVALGKASITYGECAEGEEPAFFVPSEGTTLFGMAERFVNLYGFHEDSSLLDRTILFENLCTLQEAMIGNPSYLELGIDFPNFDLSSTELEWYGIFPFYKARQIALLSATHLCRRKFGGGLLRYNPELGEEGKYSFPDISLEGLPTRPNTPESPEEPEEIGSEAAPVQVLRLLRDGF